MWPACRQSVWWVPNHGRVTFESDVLPLLPTNMTVPVAGCPSLPPVPPLDAGGRRLGMATALVIAGAGAVGGLAALPSPAPLPLTAGLLLAVGFLLAGPNSVLGGAGVIDVCEFTTGAGTTACAAVLPGASGLVVSAPGWVSHRTLPRQPSPPLLLLLPWVGNLR